MAVSGTTFVAIISEISFTPPLAIVSIPLASAIASVNSEITDLEAQRDALAVENAKITAAAADEGRSEVASAMIAAQSSGFVSE